MSPCWEVFVVEFSRFLRQIEFIAEIDKLKEIYRQNVKINSLERENDAEHSWHMAVMVVLLKEYFIDQDVDILKVIKMVLVHDLVEIDAGDTFCYDEKGNQDKAERENKAAQRIFNILPEDQADELWKLWREFEEMKTPEARFAACMDRFQPFILNSRTEGHTWQKPGVNSRKLLKRVGVLEQNAPVLWEYVNSRIEEFIDKGYLKR
ncbi:MAG: HD domain-containing protein [Clostridia bacterium]|nr:HD domain-containing protein [Clostridia bacterium]